MVGRPLTFFLPLNMVRFIRVGGTISAMVDFRGHPEGGSGPRGALDLCHCSPPRARQDSQLGIGVAGAARRGVARAPTTTDARRRAREDPVRDGRASRAPRCRASKELPAWGGPKLVLLVAGALEELNFRRRKPRSPASRQLLSRPTFGAPGAGSRPPPLATPPPPVHLIVNTFARRAIVFAVTTLPDPHHLSTIVAPRPATATLTPPSTTTTTSHPRRPSQSLRLKTYINHG